LLETKQYLSRKNVVLAKILSWINKSLKFSRRKKSFKDGDDHDNELAII